MVRLKKKHMLLFLFICLLRLSFMHGEDGEASEAAHNYHIIHHERLRTLGAIKASVLAGRGSMPPSPSPAASPPQASPRTRVFKVTDYGADPTGNSDSTEAILAAISDAFRAFDNKVLMAGIADLGGVEVHLEGGTYNISNPLRLPASGGGNVLIQGGSLLASNNFPKDRHLIELWPTSSSKLEASNFSVLDASASSYASSYEYVTLRNLLFDSNFRGGAILVIDSLRTTIDDCYITHFMSEGVLVRGGHETLIKNTFIGQHITAGGDSDEKNFSGTGISLIGNDNIVTDVVIFSAGTGVLVAGQANILTGVHCYNKATGWGGTGIYVKLPGLSQTRILNSYLDYTGIVAEDPVQLQISGSFFLGDAFIKIKSINGKVKGLNIVDNMFSGHGKGIDIVQLDESAGPFKDISQVVVDRNSVDGMKLRSTVARQSIAGNGTLWAVDFTDVLLFPNLIKHVQYSLQSDGLFPNHGLKKVSDNTVEVGTNLPVSATVYVSVDQSSSEI